MRHITMTCPVCKKPDKAVGDPQEATNGHFGAWFCFNCHAKGNYEVRFQVQDATEAE